MMKKKQKMPKKYIKALSNIFFYEFTPLTRDVLWCNFVQQTHSCFLFWYLRNQNYLPNGS